MRAEDTGDADAIHLVVQAAFREAAHRGGSEQHIVDALRRDGRLSLSLVAEFGGEIIGHLAASPVTIDGHDLGWHGLGPLSVRPDWQRRGIGQRLVTEALARLRAEGGAGCVVLGEPGYYGRFGFHAGPALHLPGMPAEYFQSLPFDTATPEGEVAFAPAFAATA
ncbi:N-acetyltransferase [Lysobacter pythonis]|uniref:N-acetyltransferase n=1 Tax=Solilutibacter pythonis TaxID=2483112 RepID=A0A3M2HM39_9GAMM|nr:N-acetyltransferase [Lysobacter pythonis]